MKQLDPLDKEEEKEETLDFFVEQKEDWSSIFYLLLFVGFIVIFSIKFYQSWPSQKEIEMNAINNERVNLLERAKNARTEAEIRAATSNYDSLTRVLQDLNNSQ